MDPVTELEGVLDAFDADGVPYALCGGLALAIHGFPRHTKDIDILVEPALVDRALAAAKRAGFDIPSRKIVFGLRVGTPREVRRVSKLDDASGKMMTLDLLVVNAELEKVWATRQVVQADSRRITSSPARGLLP